MRFFHPYILQFVIQQRSLQQLLCKILQILKSIVMSGTFISNTKPSYLDITQFVLKQHSPLIKPHPNHPQQLLPYKNAYTDVLLCKFLLQETQNQLQPMELTPEVSPIQEGKHTLRLTPLFQASKNQIFDMYIAQGLEDLQDFELEKSQKPSKTKKIQKQTSARPRLYSNWHIMEYDLQNIIEEDENNSEYSESKQENQSSEQIQNQDQQQCSDDQEDINEESSRLHNYQSKYSNTNLPINKNQVSSFEWETHNPKNQIVGHLKNILNNPQIDSDQQKVSMIKLKLKYYLFEHQYFFFEDAFKQINGPLKDIINTLIKGIEQTFKKTIAGLIFQKRRLKMLKYMEKKKGRVWRKKVNYNCRKQVADKRLRIKGKFVTLDQALEQLGLPSIDGYTPNELKQMLENRVQQQ